MNYKIIKVLWGERWLSDDCHLSSSAVEKITVLLVRVSVLLVSLPLIGIGRTA